MKTVAVPWAREGSGFTLLFEAFVMTLAKEMPVNAIARLVGEYDTRIWRILTHYVEQARRNQDYSQVQELGIDETSRKRGITRSRSLWTSGSPRCFLSLRARMPEL